MLVKNQTNPVAGLANTAIQLNTVSENTVNEESNVVAEKSKWMIYTELSTIIILVFDGKLL